MKLISNPMDYALMSVDLWVKRKLEVIFEQACCVLYFRSWQIFQHSAESIWLWNSHARHHNVSLHIRCLNDFTSYTWPPYWEPFVRPHCSRNIQPHLSKRKSCVENRLELNLHNIKNHTPEPQSVITSNSNQILNEQESKP